MKIIKTPPAPESPLGYLYAAQESLNALARTNLHRKALNKELAKLREKGANEEQLDFCKYYFKYSSSKDWTKLTKVFSIIFEEVNGKPTEQHFGFLINMSINLFSDGHPDLRDQDEKSIRSYIKNWIDNLEKKKTDNYLRNFPQ